MDVFETIRNRRSVRCFKDTPISKETIECLIDLARWAPSNCNIQGWRFIIVNDAELKQQLVEHGASTVVKSAPLGILVCYDNRSINLEYNDWLQSAAAASQNILLGAHALGLGSCWLCHLPRHTVLRNIFKIPYYYTPVAYLALGYPLKQPETVRRHRPIKELYDYNRFPQTTDVSDAPRFIFWKRIVCSCYHALPLRIKKRINMFIDTHFIKKYKN